MNMETAGEEMERERERGGIWRFLASLSRHGEK